MKNHSLRKIRVFACVPILAMIMCGSSIRSMAKVVPLNKLTTIDVNVVVHGNIGASQSDIEEFVEDLLEAAKYKVVDDGDGPDVLEITVTIEVDDDDDDDDGIPDAKDEDDDGDGEKDDADHDDHNDGKGFHITIEVEGDWHVDTDSDTSDTIDDQIKDIFDEVLDHIKEIK